MTPHQVGACANVDLAESDEFSTARHRDDYGKHFGTAVRPRKVCSATAIGDVFGYYRRNDLFLFTTRGFRHDQPDLDIDYF